ncbi:hypothetical protein, partial [Mesorhizobium sp. M7A.F.Ca.US.007.01.2.1]|uniref:hypothetical protein n=1 Tax=Mesorhizobium sp. M7A.F.Ca.US.007.01.2.1 TaxID=2496711 RepID=UPI0019CF7102
MYLANFTKTAFWFPDQTIRKHLHANEFRKVLAGAGRLFPSTPPPLVAFARTPARSGVAGNAI